LKSVPNRVLQVVGERTALQRNIILERMLALIAQFVPSLIRNDIINKSTSLTWIWHRVRKHYSFAQSEVNFLKLSNIKRESDKRYETFFQRIIAHLEDNERLAVYMGLTLIDERFPGFAHDLQSKTIKEIQPQLAEAMFFSRTCQSKMKSLSITPIHDAHINRANHYNTVNKGVPDYP